MRREAFPEGVVVVDTSPISSPHAVKVNTTFIQTGPNTYELVAMTNTGQFMGRIECLVVAPESLPALAGSFAQLASQHIAQSGKGLVRAAGDLPPFPRDAARNGHG
jgi:hypothetical protein